MIELKMNSLNTFVRDTQVVHIIRNPAEIIKHLFNKEAFLRILGDPSRFGTESDKKVRVIIIKQIARHISENHTTVIYLSKIVMDWDSPAADIDEAEQRMRSQNN